jgi:hypothetical protein
LVEAVEALALPPITHVGAVEALLVVVVQVAAVAQVYMTQHMMVHP